MQLDNRTYVRVYVRSCNPANMQAKMAKIEAAAREKARKMQEKQAEDARRHREVRYCTCILLLHLHLYTTSQEQEARERALAEAEDKRREEEMARKLKEAKEALDRKIKWLHKYG